MSTARSRQQRRKGKTERAPGVLRGALQRQDKDTRTAVGHGTRRGGRMNWRVVSGMIFLSMSFVMVTFFVTDFFYIRTIEVAGADTLTPAEVFRYAGIAESHLFWIDPDEVRERILETSPVIADVEVQVGWPPNAVRIVAEEREPALVWVQSGVAALVDVHGRVLRFPREENADIPPELLRVVSEAQDAGPPGFDAPLDRDAITGALQLQTLLPGIRELRYTPRSGLGFREPGGWEVWLGTGTDMRNKLLIYEALSARLQQRGIVPLTIDVSDPDGLYYCCQP